MRISTLPGLLMEVVAWVQYKFAPKCVDCNGRGFRKYKAYGYAGCYVPCTLCRGTGRITD